MGLRLQPVFDVVTVLPATLFKQVVSQPGNFIMGRFNRNNSFHSKSSVASGKQPKMRKVPDRSRCSRPRTNSSGKIKMEGKVSAGSITSCCVSRLPFRLTKLSRTEALAFRLFYSGICARCSALAMPLIWGIPTAIIRFKEAICNEADCVLHAAKAYC